ASPGRASNLVERVNALAEHALRQLDAALAELLEEDRAEARCPETARDRAVRRHRVALELEHVVELDDVRLHAEDLRDRHDATGSVLEAVDVHEQVESGRD